MYSEPAYEDTTELIIKQCTGCEKEQVVQEDEVTCPHCGTVTLQEK